MTFKNCSWGDSTYTDSDFGNFTFIATNTPKQIAGVRRFGSIFGEGSLTMIVALLALIASGVAIFLTVYYNKKKTAPVAADKEEENKADNEE